MKLADMTALDPAETSRTYTFPEGDTIKLVGVTHLKVSDSGTHRLATADGKLHIVPPTWRHIEIEAKDWTI